MKRGAALRAWLAVMLLSTAAPAFCGFFVSGASGKLTNDASMVVLLRDGTRTVLSMQNDYAGPPADFALVIPVPVVLERQNVRTLGKEIFDRIDGLGAPRLVEYWEQDPCPPEMEEEDSAKEGGSGTRAKGEEGSMGKRYGIQASVTVEAKFAVGEYEIVILSAKDSSGLDAWLREERYAIPDGAEEVLRPYVAAGSKFFVAKVDVKKVRFSPEGRLRLSPLRFHYDSETFTLPVRLGLLNSPGKQDIVVNILAKDRFEVANYPNVTIPTNLDVEDSVRHAFPQFYAALFDKTLETHPRAVVTEYAWRSSSCDPCTGPVLQESDVRLLGGDVTQQKSPDKLTLTRLHARYAKGELGADLVFRAASPLVGGRENWTTDAPTESTFQGRYAIRHRWKGPIRCKDPMRDSWGGPPSGLTPTAERAKDLATAPRGPDVLKTYLRSDVPALGLEAERTNDLPSRYRPLRFLGGGAVLGLALVMTLLRRRGAVG